MTAQNTGEPITYFDRYSGEYRLEEIYGDRALRFAYETSIGKAGNWLLFSRPFFSRLFGWKMKRPASRRKILPFITHYGLDPSEFRHKPEEFSSFNDFFKRELEEGARPVDPRPDTVVFPADARHSGWQQIGSEDTVFVKGQSWNLLQLLGGDQSLAEKFMGGALVLSRLCPVDYHHFHFPVSGRLQSSHWQGQRLYSVSPVALKQNLGYLWSNKRCINIIQTDDAGLCCFIEVGATNVGTIQHRSLPGENRFRKGDPKGWFEFGGSSVITLFQHNKVRLCQDLVELSDRGIELYAKVGDVMGEILSG